MLHSLSVTSISWLELIIRAAAVYIFVFIMLRLSGKRQLTQMSPTEFVALLLISNAVQNSMNGGDNSLVGGLILATVLVGVSRLSSVLAYRSARISRIIEGTPTLLIHNGKVIEKNLKKELLTLSDLRIMLRKQGLHDFDSIGTAVFESDGSLSILKKEDLEKGETSSYSQALKSEREFQ